jgi:diaminohydroxyphosphoribosylaminopyrimidine deaminase/5-amino-6-(5-phosphoribosylamino)uracil reductase
LLYPEVDILDEKYMRRALELAQLGVGYTSPNPMVGAVIVKDGRVIGEGWHHRCGGLHAEREALASLSESAEGATMYVTLEPCCHEGRQPPCTQAILESGIARVVVGSGDPNPLVAGKGISILREHGVEVTEGVLREECDAINYVFFHYIRTKTPYAVMKYAMTLDGKIATRTGSSKWITGEQARQQVQRDRHRYSGIMVGIGTVLADDPALTCRIPGGKNPTRIICDSALRTPTGSQIVTSAHDVPTIIATAVSDSARYAPYTEAGCEVVCLPDSNGRVDLTALMKYLGGREIDSVLLEGGGTLNWAMLERKLVQRVQAYVAPKLFGGEGAKSPVRGEGVAEAKDAIMLKNPRILHFGEDIMIESEVE